MRIILAPAKKMRVDPDTMAPSTVPVFLDSARDILAWLQNLDYAQAKALWACSDTIATDAYELLQHTDLRDTVRLTPAVLAYDGIAFTYMAPSVFEEGFFAYVQEHLRILSGLYGVLKPLDGIVPYRLEMQAKAQVAGSKNLYAYWGERIYREVADSSGVIVNLASKEYAKCVEAYLQPSDQFVTCIFGELSGDKVVQKGVYAKMARGDMVRFMAENRIEDVSSLARYDRMGYRFSADRSTGTEFVFLRDQPAQAPPCAPRPNSQ